MRKQLPNPILKPVLGLLLTIACLSQSSAPVFAEYHYQVLGKEVTKNVYDAVLLVNDSITLIKQNAYERALGKLKRAALLAPELPHTYTYMGIIFARQSRNADALKQLTKAIKCKDAPAQSYAVLATFYQTSGDLDKAIDTFKQMNKKFADTPSVTDSSRKILSMLEKERERRKTATGSSKGSTTQADYLQDALQAGFHRWSSRRMPLKVYIRPSVDVEGYLPSYDVLLKEGFYDWSKALNQQVTFTFVDDEDKADIVCHWTNDPEELGDGTEDGETKIRVAGQLITKATLALRAKETDGGFPFSENLVATTCRHEAGHALGLSGHSPDPRDVMFFAIPLADINRPVSSRDKNTMMKIYSKEQSLEFVLLDLILNPVNCALVGLLTMLIVGLLFILPKLGKSKLKKRRQV